MAGYNHFFVRAQYDFVSTDPSSLSFKKGDVIEVLTQLESGWWDGILENGQRGWFPSNYTITIDPAEAPLEMLQDSRMDQQQKSTAEVTQRNDQKLLTNDDKASDYWIPQATDDGDIFYFNTQTGESSWEVPMHVMPEIEPLEESSVISNSRNLFNPSPSHNLRNQVQTSTQILQGLAQANQQASLQASSQLGSSFSYPSPHLLSTTDQHTTSQSHHPPSYILSNDQQNPFQNQHYPSPYLSTNDHLSSSQSPYSTENRGSTTPIVQPTEFQQRRPSVATIATSATSVASSQATSVKVSSNARPRSQILSRGYKLNPNLPEPWITQPTEDGSTYYYLNTVTKEIRWTHPSSNGGTLPSSFASSSTSATPGTVYTNQAISASPSVSSKNISVDHDTSYHQVVSELDNRPLPTNWTRKVTASGKVTYLNPRTGQTANSLSSIESQTTSTQRNRLSRTSQDSDILNESVNENLPPPFELIKEICPVVQPLDGLPPYVAISWDDLATQVYDNINMLNEAASMFEKALYTSRTDATVEAVRIMLYLSGTLDKDSQTVKQYRSLKVHHRHIMASLSKLVLSTKVASGVWPPIDAVMKMQSDAQELYQSVQKFVQAAQESQLTIKRVVPQLAGDGTGGSWTGNGIALSSGDSKENFAPKRQPTTEILNVFDLQARAVSKSIAILQSQVKKTMDIPTGASSNISLAPQLISQARAVASHVGQFLQAAEDLNLGDLVDFLYNHVANHQSNTSIAAAIYDYQMAKQSLYNNMAGLIIATQYSTLSYSDVMETRDALEKVTLASDAVESTVRQLTTSVSYIVEEKDILDQWNARGDGVTQRKISIDNLSATPAMVMATTATLATGFVGNRRVCSMTFSSGKSPIDEFSGYAASDSSYGSGLGIMTSRSFSLSRNPTSESTSDMTGGTSTVGAMDMNGRPNGTGDQPFYDNKPEDFEMVDDLDDDDFGIEGRRRKLNSNTSGSMSKNKLKDLLGEDVEIPTSTGNAAVVTKVRDDKPWYLGYNYQSSEIVFNMEGHVKGGTLTALVERLTMHDSFDLAFNNTFLLTYRSFATTEEFFNLLVARFLIEPPPNLIKEQLDEWVEKKQVPIRLRVFNIMKSWLDSFFLDDDDESVLSKFWDFATNVMAESMPAPAQQLARLVEKRQQNRFDGFKKMVLNMSMQAPAPILPKNMKKLKFVEMEPLELARQLTIIESRLYCKIKPVECLNKAWSRDDGSETAQNIKAMILNSNQITGWVAEAILNQNEVKKRVNIIKHFVGVAESCRKLNNFSTLTAIISGLNSAPIHRLKRTWELASAKTMAVLEQLNRVMQSTKNFSEYREMLHGINPPCVPFLGVYLTDLTFIEDGNPNMIKKNKSLINFSKRMKTAEVIREIQVYQAVPYCLTPVPELQVFLKSHLQESRDVADLYQQSLDMEPRERDDEKIARLLQESGFL